MADTLLDIVDENDQVIGQALRSEVHAKGLLHREVGVFFVTPDRQLVLQKRSMTKEAHPGLLGPTVGGHVDTGETYEEAVLREALEETGILLGLNDIVPLTTIKYHSKSSGNNAIRKIYGHVFKGTLDQLLIEKHDGDGFESVPLDNFFDIQEPVRSRILPSLFDRDKYGDIIHALQKMVS